MFLKNVKLTESAYTGEELLGGADSALDRKCLVVKQVVQDGNFTLEKALKLYKVTRDDYERFLAKTALEQINSAIAGNRKHADYLVTVEILKEMVKSISEDVASRHVVSKKCPCR